MRSSVAKSGVPPTRGEGEGSTVGAERHHFGEGPLGLRPSLPLLLLLLLLLLLPQQQQLLLLLQAKELLLPQDRLLLLAEEELLLRLRRLLPLGHLLRL